jgi:3-hydroxyacyl-CoA dehydrogenase
MGTKAELAALRHRYLERMQQATEVLQHLYSNQVDAGSTKQRIQDLLRDQRQEPVNDALQRMFRDAAAEAIASLDLVVDAVIAQNRLQQQSVDQRQAAREVMDHVWRAAGTDYDTALTVVEARLGTPS